MKTFSLRYFTIHATFPLVLALREPQRPGGYTVVKYGYVGYPPEPGVSRYSHQDFTGPLSALRVYTACQ